MPLPSFEPGLSSQKGRSFPRSNSGIPNDDDDDEDEDENEKNEPDEPSVIRKPDED